MKHQKTAIRHHRITVMLDKKERRALNRIQKYVKTMTGEAGTAETLRFLIRNWSSP